MNKATKQNTEWEPWDKVAIFSTCPQPELIEEALEEAPDGVELRIRFGQNYGNAFHMIFNKQKEGWKDEHGMEKTAKDIGRLIEAFRVLSTQNSLSTSRQDGAFRESAQY